MVLFEVRVDKHADESRLVASCDERALLRRNHVEDERVRARSLRGPEPQYDRGAMASLGMGATIASFVGVALTASTFVLIAPLLLLGILPGAECEPAAFLCEVADLLRDGFPEHRPARDLQSNQPRRRGGADLLCPARWVVNEERARQPGPLSPSAVHLGYGI